MRLRLFHHREHATCEVTLSRRNLLALLQKLDMEGSARTLTSDHCPPGLELVVRAEDDQEHYSDRVEPPGPIHPSTEAFIRVRTEEPAIPGADQELDDQGYRGDSSKSCSTKNSPVNELVLHGIGLVKRGATRRQPESPA